MKNEIFFGLGIFVSILLAELLSRRWGLPVAGWFFGGVLMALSGQIFLVPKDKRRTGKLIFATLFTGIVASGTYFCWTYWF